MSNKLIIGIADKTEELTTTPGFLLIDDGPIADAFLHRFKRAKQFLPAEHGFNPLPMTYRRSREFASVVFGEEGTRSKRGRPWSEDNCCTVIVQPPVPGVSPYRCHNNGIHN